MAAPVISSSLTATSQAGEAFSYSITGTNTPTSYGAIGLPAGLSVNTVTGAITGTWPITPFPQTQPATISFTISATNGSGTGSATLVVTPTNPTVVQFTGQSGNCAKDDTLGATSEIVYQLLPPLMDGPNGAKTVPGCGQKFWLTNTGTHAIAYDRKTTAAGTTGTTLAAGAQVLLETIFGHLLFVGSASGSTIAFTDA